MGTIYRDDIIEHYKFPQNFGKLVIFDANAVQINPFCGDEIEMFVKFKQDKIDQVGFIGRGCAISIAGTSILTEYMQGKKKSVLTKLSQQDMLNLLSLDISEARKKCALLGWAVMQDCLIV